MSDGTIGRRAFLMRSGFGVAAMAEVEAIEAESAPAPNQGLTSVVFPDGIPHQDGEAISYPITIPPGVELLAITIRPSSITLTYNRRDYDDSI